MTTPDEIVARELARLSANFVEQLPAQIRVVEGEVTAWLDAPKDAELYASLRHRVHQLKGSGSTFGCPGISRAARRLERRIGMYQGDIDAGRTPAAAAVQSAMARLQVEGRRAQDSAPDPEGGV